MTAAGLVAALLVAAGCATGALRDAKNAYNAGDYEAAWEAAERAAEDPQARLVAARSQTRLAGPDPDATIVAEIGFELRLAAAGWPFGEAWADRELAAGIGDWLLLAGLPEVAAAYYRAAVDAAGDVVEPGELAAAEGLVQAGLEALDRWEPDDRERARQLRELDRIARRLLDDSGFPYPPGLADQAVRVAWAAGDHQAAFVLGAAGWLRATAAADREAAATLAGRLDELVVPDWRAAVDSAAVDDVVRAWRLARRGWQAGPR